MREVQMPVKGHPTVVDSVLVKYKGQYFNSTTELIDFDESVQFNQYGLLYIL